MMLTPNWLARSRWDGSMLPRGTAVVLHVVPLAIAASDYRYLLPVLPFACLAAGLAFAPARVRPAPRDDQQQAGEQPDSAQRPGEQPDSAQRLDSVQRAGEQPGCEQRDDLTSQVPGPVSGA